MIVRTMWTCLGIAGDVSKDPQCLPVVIWDYNSRRERLLPIDPCVRPAIDFGGKTYSENVVVSSLLPGARGQIWGMGNRIM